MKSKKGNDSRLMVRVPIEVSDQLKSMSVEHGLSVSVIVRQAIEHMLTGAITPKKEIVRVHAGKSSPGMTAYMREMGRQLAKSNAHPLRIPILELHCVRTLRRNDGETEEP